MPASTILYAVIQRRSHINKFIIIIFLTFQQKVQTNHIILMFLLQSGQN